MRIHLLFAAAVGALAACSALDPQADGAAGAAEITAAQFPGGPAGIIRYVCEDGSTVEARYPTPDGARIGYQGRTIDMTIARSASGARYVGGGWEWWTRGMIEGTLTPLGPGEEIASAPGLGCAAPGVPGP